MGGEGSRDADVDARDLKSRASCERDAAASVVADMDGAEPGRVRVEAREPSKSSPAANESAREWRSGVDIAVSTAFNSPCQGVPRIVSVSVRDRANSSDRAARCARTACS